MRITDIQERTIPISRYADPAIASGGLTTSLVAVVTDTVRDGRPVVGYGFSSIGRYGQGGLIRERFAPRLLRAPEAALLGESEDNLDPFKAWRVMMAGEKPGGHGERCVAVGTLDMALWDAAAKCAGVPLHVYLAGRLERPWSREPRVAVYAGGGYVYPDDDLRRLGDEMRLCRDLGFTRAKIKISAQGLEQDLRRIEACAEVLGGHGNLAVDAMNTFGPLNGQAAASVLAPLGLWWFEDICDPLDFETQAGVVRAYEPPVAAGEALFSVAEARLLARHGGLRPDRDVLVFDPVHCYGLPGYLGIVEHFEGQDWQRRSFWPHGGHLFSLHLVAALGLGGAEVSPLAFAPFRGLADGMAVEEGFADLPQAPGIGFEAHAEAREAFRGMVG